MLYVLVAGSRTFKNYELLKTKMDYYLKNYSDVCIVSGGAYGADTLAIVYAKEKGYPYKIFPAQWNTYGKSAGYKRNIEMHKFIAQYPKRGCVCFWDGKSKGTQHNFELCKKYNTPLRIVKEN